jgi:hypothetical protein
VKVWLPLGNGNEFEDGRSNQPEYVQTKIPFIKIAEVVWPVFQSKEGREQIRKEILIRWPVERVYTLAEAIEDLFVRAERFEEIIALFSSKPGSNYGPVLPKISHQNLSSNAAVSALCRHVSALVHGQKADNMGYSMA